MTRGYAESFRDYIRSKVFSLFKISVLLFISIPKVVKNFQIVVSREETEKTL